MKTRPRRPRPRMRPVASLLVAATLASASVGLTPSVSATPGGSVRTVAGEVSGRIDREQTFQLPMPASHIALHWPGQPDARLSVALSNDGEAFGPATDVVIDEVGEQRGNGETYGAVIVAWGATAVHVRTDRPLPRLTVLAMDSSGQPQTSWSLGPAVATAAEQPSVISRAGWAADESRRFDSSGNEIWPRDFHPIQKLIVHHTAGINNDPNPAATIRSIYYYHAVTQGWGDIGYNFLIDEAGRVYEGRHAREYAAGEAPTGEDLEGRGVTAGHARGFNAGTMGVALLGTLSDRDTTAPARDALERLLAWKAERHRIDPHGSSTYVNPVDGTRGVFPNIAGHRDVHSTECPGSTFYSTLPALRSAVYRRADPPQLVSRSPAPSAANVPTATTVDVAFSEPVTGVWSGSFYLRDTSSWATITGRVSYDPSTLRAVLQPTETLLRGRAYRVELSGSIRDASGFSLPWQPWTFTTDGTAPRLVARTPAAGATNVVTTTSVSVTFSEPVTGVRSASFYVRDATTWNVVSATVTYDAATRTALLRPATPLTRGRTYRVELSGSIRDLSGNALPWKPWSFTTAP